jgi:multimeric flavodoxin WrbA
VRVKPVLSIIWHSRTGAAHAIALAMEHAAIAFDIDVRCIAADQANAENLLKSDGVIFCAPENLGGLSGMMKDFFDRSYYPALDRCNGKAYAQVIAAGSDGMGAARQLARIATGLRLRAIAEPMIVLVNAQTSAEILAKKNLSAEQLAPAIELAAGFAAGLEAGIY